MNLPDVGDKKPFSTWNCAVEPSPSLNSNSKARWTSNISKLGGRGLRPSGEVGGERSCSRILAISTVVSVPSIMDSSTFNGVSRSQRTEYNGMRWWGSTLCSWYRANRSKVFRSSFLCSSRTASSLTSLNSQSWASLRTTFQCSTDAS